MAITFDVEEITGKLDAIRLTQLPFAASRAANQLGWELKNSAWPAFARRAFTSSGPPVPFTTGGGGVVGGLLYKHNRGEPKLEISLDRPAPKGQDPARYLAPTESGGSIYITRFSRAVKSRGYMPSNYQYAAPLKGSNGFAGQMNGKVIKPGYYQSILAGLARGSTPTKTPSGNRSVPSIWNFEEFAERESLPILERILPQFIEEALK
jgi:hypothetical protein